MYPHAPVLLFDRLRVLSSVLWLVIFLCLPERSVAQAISEPIPFGDPTVAFTPAAKAAKAQSNTTFSVFTIIPMQGATHVATNADIVITFDSANLNAATVNAATLAVVGDQTGPRAGFIHYPSAHQVRIEVTGAYKPGEVIRVQLSDGIEDSGGARLVPFQAEFTAAAAAGARTFNAPNVVSTTADGIDAVDVADLDGDGDLDLLSASSLDHTLAWYENDGSQTFTTHTISSTFTGANAISSSDLDQDGDLDLLVTSETNQTLAWYENDGNEAFMARTITTTATGARALLAADVDGDHDLDLIAAAETGNVMLWYENDGPESFTTHTLTNTEHDPTAVYTTDLDRDGDLDVLAAFGTDDKVMWYENNGDSPLTFTSHTVATNINHASSVYATDVDSDGDIDVLSTSRDGDTVAWHDNTGNQAFITHTLDTNADGARAVQAADVDGDGDMDIVAASENDDTVAWYQNNGSESFTKNILTTTADGAAAIHAADIDSDGDLDIITASGLDDTVAWYQQGPAPFSVQAVTPQHNAHDVVSHTAVTVTFNKALDTSTASATTFTVRGSQTGPVSGTFSFPSSNQLRFVPSTPFQSGETLHILATTGLQSSDGSALQPYQWQFTADVTAGTRTFTAASPPLSTTADGASSVYAADVDRDGDLDAISASFNDGTIAWYQNTGNKTFTTHIIETNAPGAYNVHAADVDGDGDMDILSASSQDHTLAWYENNGSQSFSKRFISASATGVTSVHTADVDSDGDLDVIGALFSANTVAWYENDGNTNFTQRTLTLNATSVLSVHAADVDGDGDIDILSASRDDDTVAWYENDGNQSFTTRTITTSADGATWVYTADVDSDGDVDVLSTSENDNTVAWYENDGNQSFTTRTITTSADGAYAVHAVDLDGDGDTDILSASHDDNTVAWYENDGNQAFTTHTLTTNANFAFGVYAADLDTDGNLDILTASLGDDTVTWYEQRPLNVRVASTSPSPSTTNVAADFSPVITLTAPLAEATGMAALIRGSQAGRWFFQTQSNDTSPQVTLDRSGDFLPGEVVSVTLPNLQPGTGIFVPYQWQFTVASGNGPGTFTTAQTLSTTADGATALYPADVDSDGDIDVFGASENDNTLVWFENDGIGTFSSHTITTAATGITSVYGTDLDTDTDLDVLIALNGANEIAWYENDGNESFSWHSITTSAGGVRAVYASDLDTDGDMDILSASFASDAIAWYENDGNQSFTAHMITTTAMGATALHVGDLDGDGDLDVLSASETDDTIAWYENDGATDPTFTAHTITTTADQAASVYAQDVDGDGDLDVVAASILDDTVAWFENNGAADPSFTQHAITITSDGARGVHAADVDGDGDMDVLAAAESANTVTWYENDGSQSFTSHTLTTAALGARAVHAADLNGDTMLDVLAASPADDTFRWFPHTTATFALTTPSPSAASVDVATTSTLGATFDAPLSTATVSATTFAARSSLTGKQAGTLSFPSPNEVRLDPAQDFRAGETIHVVAASGIRNTAGEALDPYQWQFTVASASGTGIFGAEQAISVNTNATSAFDLADMDGDGDLDAITTFFFSDTGLGLTWYENNGLQSFTPHAVDTQSHGSQALTAADVDGDGDMDILTNLRDSQTLVWYENDGATSFTRHTLASNAGHVLQLGAGDVDGDGDVDVVSATINGVFWYANDGAESFTAHTVATLSTNNSPSALHAADLNNDGDLDLVVAWNSTDTIVWYENGGVGVFSGQQVITTSADGIADIHVADVDGDGDLDVLAASENDDTVAWYAHNGAATPAFTQHIITASADGARGVMAADLDGDGDLDILAASTNDDTVAWYINNGAINPTFTLQPLTTTADHASTPRAIDMDRDGDLDVVLFRNPFTSPADLLTWYEHIPAGPQISVLGNTLRIADGDLTPSTTDGTDFGSAAASGVTTSQTFTLESIGTTVLDLGLNAVSISGSHASDFMVTTQPAPTVAVGATTTFTITFDPSALGVRTATVSITHNATGAPHTFAIQGTGTDVQQVIATAPRTGATDAARDASVTATLNFDINPATVSANTFTVRGSQTGTRTGTLSLPTSSQITFDPTLDFRAGEQIEVVATGGIQSDASGALQAYQWHFNAAAQAASRTFTAPTVIGNSVNGPVPVYPADLDSDGDLDLLLGTQGDGTSGSDDFLLWYENDGTQTFTAHTLQSGIADVTAVTAADLDGDGDLDVLSASYTDDTIAWYENDGTESFTRHIITTSTNGAFWVQAKDVDSDGDLDVLTASLLDNTIAWYENDGAQSFTRHTITTTASQGIFMDASDLDGDGDLDVVAAVSGDQKLYWYANDGNASPTFSTHTLASNIENPQSVQIVDLDGDHDLDVLLARHGSPHLTWYENQGTTSFPSRAVITSLTNVTHAQAADMDGDGDQDIVTASASSFTPSAVAWHENNGSESFTQHNIAGALLLATRIAAADLDGDDDLDILATSFTVDALVWYEQDTIAPEINVLGNNMSIASGDLTPTADDHTHFGSVATNTGAVHRTFTIANTGNGPLTLGSNAVTLSGPDATDFTVLTQPASSVERNSATTFGLVFRPSAAGARTVTLSIANNDPDENPYTFVVEGTGVSGFSLTNTTPSNSISLQARNATVSATFASVLDQASVSPATFTVHGDQSGRRTGAFSFPTSSQLVFDPTTDFFPGEHVVVVASSVLQSASSDVLVPHQWHFVAASASGAGTFDTPNTITTTADYAVAVHAADLDGDGDVDVLSASEDDDTIAWYQNNGSGSFTAQTPLNTNASTAEDVYAADLDGDGDVDVLSASRLDNTIEWYENDGATNPTFTAHTITTLASGATSVYAADLDGDGDIDVLSSSQFDDTIAWYANDGAASPTFTRHVVSTSVDLAYAVLAADIDGDGDLDILSASAGDDTIAWYESDGTGLPTFTRQIVATPPGLALAVYAADLDGDGDLDVLSSSAGDQTIAWHENNGATDPLFTEHVLTTAHTFVPAVYAADVDGDGDVDILSASANDDIIAWYKNDGSTDPTFTKHTLTTAMDLPLDVYTADLNGDGDLDLLTASGSDNTIAWLDQDNATLPVELTMFTAIQDANDLVLHWQTASETNNAGFEVQQRMPDAIWHTLDFVEGTGTTVNAQQYEHRVALSASGLHTFRLKQIDYDGTFSYSDLLEVEAVVAFTWGLEPAYPNPSNAQTHLRYTVATPSRIHLAIYDVVGREVTVLENRVQDAGHYEVVWSSTGIANGMYLVRLTTAQGTFTRTVVLQR